MDIMFLLDLRREELAAENIEDCAEKLGKTWAKKTPHLGGVISGQADKTKRINST